jgi:hypothetical protein
MPQAFDDDLLSGSTHGVGIAIAAAPGTVVHLAVPSVTNRDKVALWVCNNNANGASRTLTLQVGAGATCIMTIPPRKGLIPVWPSLPMRNGLELRLTADAAGDLVAWGDVQEVTIIP